MSSVVIRELLTLYGFDVETEQIDKGEQALGQLKSRAMALTGILVGAGAAWIGFTRSVANAGDTAAKTGARIGLTAEEVQEIDFAAQIAGSSINAMERGIRGLSRRAADAVDGNEDLRKTFRDLGVELKDEQGELRGTSDLLEDVIGGLNGVDNDTRRLATAQEILGRSGSEMLQAMERSGVSFSELRQEARETAIVLDNETAAAAEHLNDTIFRLRMFLRGLVFESAPELIAAATHISEGILTWARANREIIRSGFDRFLTTTTRAFRGMFRVASAVADTLLRMVDAVGGLNRVITVLQFLLVGLGLHQFGIMVAAAARLVWGWVTAQRALNAAMLITKAMVALKFIVFGALAGLVLLLIEDFQKFYAGQDSWIGELLNRYPLLGASILALADAFITVGSSALDFFAILTGSHNKAYNEFDEMGRRINENGELTSNTYSQLAWLISHHFTKAVEEIKEQWAELRENTADLVDSIGDFFSGAADRAREAFFKAVDDITEKLLGMPGAELLIDAVQGISQVSGGVANTGAELASRFQDDGIMGAGMFGAEHISGRLAGMFGGGESRGGDTNVGGDTYDIDINAPNANAEEVRDELEKTLRERDEQKRRRLAAAGAGGVVR